MPLIAAVYQRILSLVAVDTIGRKRSIDLDEWNILALFTSQLAKNNNDVLFSGSLIAARIRAAHDFEFLGGELFALNGHWTDDEMTPQKRYLRKEVRNQRYLTGTV
jgi:hypothetical protein